MDVWLVAPKCLSEVQSAGPDPVRQVQSGRLDLLFALGTLFTFGGIMNARMIACALLTCELAALSLAGERTERFDKDPGWEGINNRSTEKPRTIKQDFGYSADTANAGGQKGEIGGFVTAAAEPAWYAKKIETKTFDDAFSASGRLIFKDRAGHLLLGLFNSESVNDWRTPNCIAIRMNGRGDVFYAYVEYATSRWRAGGDTPGGFATVRDAKSGKLGLRGFKTGVVHEWSLRYDPKANNGGGSITVTLGGETAVCHISPGHRADGATFNRFGLLPVLKSANGGGEFWLDDLTMDGKADDFSRDPQWEGNNNRRTYQTTNIRPRFDFGFSPTQHAGGQAVGELGGLIFRGDCRYPARMAAYGDRLKELSLEKPLKASGKISLRRGVSDSTVLLGFYHSKDSLEVNKSQDSGIPRCFLGLAVEGPSREGFFAYPMYRVKGDGQGHANGPTRPHILPDGKPHDWALEYDPAAAEGKGRIVVALDGKSSEVILGAGHKTTGARFDRFGLVTTWIDGNGQHVYFDDLTYTFEQ